ncbi:MAG: ABC transporter permease [Candidatus Moranbacteria bacterium]|nr:ABC transporter permease [Candidatus Moranbacteria bacterium]
MKTIKLWRTFKEGADNYRRNGWLTFATVSVLTLSLFAMGLTGLIGFAGNLALRNLQEKISISVNFQPQVSEDRILSIKKDLVRYREVSSVDYISRDQALDDFLKNGDPVFSEAVKEIGDNPLLSSLVIKADDPSNYDLIAKKLEQSDYKGEIQDINYERNKKKIETLNDLTRRSKDIGFLIGAAFMLIAVLITFNTIRLTIYSHRQEFEVMRLVGASNVYIRMPFFFEGIFYGLSGAFTTLILLTVVSYVMSRNIGPLFSELLGSRTFFGVYLSTLWVFIPAAIIIGILLGVISGFIAIRRYLKV